MQEKRIASITPPNKSYPRQELEEMAERCLKANVHAEKDENWTKYPGPMFAEDAVYSWNVGPNEEFFARGRQRDFFDMGNAKDCFFQKFYGNDKDCAQK